MGGRQRKKHGYLSRLDRKAVVPTFRPPEFDESDFPHSGTPDRLLHERAPGLFGVCARSSVIEVRKGNHIVPEQEAIDVDKGENPANTSVLSCDQVVAPMPEGRFDDGLPRNTVIYGGMRGPEQILLQPLEIV